MTKRRRPLIEEVERFAGAELVYANFDDETMRRLREAAGDQP